MAIVKPTPEQLAERAEMKGLAAAYENGPTIRLSLRVAKECGLAAGILYPYLQTKQAEQKGYSDEHNVRQGLRWIPSLTYEQIRSDLACFDSVTTIKAAANELVEAGLIKIESTGAFLKASHRTGRKRDIATWWHVKNTTRTDGLTLVMSEIMQHGLSGAAILAHLRSLPEIEKGHKQLSAAAMAKTLPLDERTIRRQLKNLTAAGGLTPHPTKRKLYRV